MLIGSKFNFMNRIESQVGAILVPVSPIHLF